MKGEIKMYSVLYLSRNFELKTACESQSLEYCQDIFADLIFKNYPCEIMKRMEDGSEKSIFSWEG